MTTSDSSNFITNVGNLSYTYTFDSSLSTSNPIYAAMLGLSGTYVYLPRANNLPDGIDSDIANQLNNSSPFTRIEGFFAYIAKYGAPSVTGQTPAQAFATYFNYLVGGQSPNASFSTSNPIYQALKNTFLDTTDLPSFLSNLTPPLTSAQQSALEESMFSNAFTNFLNTYPFAAYSSSGGNAANFFQAFATYVTQTASYNSGTSQGSVLQDYQTIYDAFISQLQAVPASPGQPSMTPPTLGELLTNFINSENTQNGFFIPSQSLGDWVNLVQNTYTAYLTGAGAAYNTSVTTAQTARAIVLFKVLGLLITMINSIQKVAAAQADRLNFLSSWQNAYTSLASQVHFFAYGDGSYIDGKTAQTNYFDDRFREKSNGNIWIKVYTDQNGTDKYMSYPSDWVDDFDLYGDRNDVNKQIQNLNNSNSYSTISTTYYTSTGLTSAFTLGSYDVVGTYNGYPVYRQVGAPDLYYIATNQNNGDLISTVEYKYANLRSPSDFVSEASFEKVAKPGSAPTSFTSTSGLAAQSAARDTGNQRGQNYVQTLQNFQAIISNAAKSLQSNLNQSTDSANQQASFVDAILQKMSSIISTIFK